MCTAIYVVINTRHGGGRIQKSQLFIKMMLINLINLINLIRDLVVNNDHIHCVEQRMQLAIEQGLTKR